MVEFFRNIGTWLIEHKDGIVVFFTSSNFIAFISTIILIVKQIAATKASITEVSTANQTLTKTNVLAENVKDVSDTAKLTETEVQNLKDNVIEMENKLNKALSFLEQKLDAIIDVQSIVYSTIRDETVRQNVANILTSAKFFGDSTKAEMQQEITRLKEAIEATVAVANDAVNKNKEKLNNTSADNTKSKKSKTSAPRYM